MAAAAVYGAALSTMSSSSCRPAVQISSKSILIATLSDLARITSPGYQRIIRLPIVELSADTDQRAPSIVQQLLKSERSYRTVCESAVQLNGIFNTIFTDFQTRIRLFAYCWR